jgi:hypothetical protein
MPQHLVFGALKKTKPGAYIVPIGEQPDDGGTHE